MSGSGEPLCDLPADFRGNGNDGTRNDMQRGDDQIIRGRNCSDSKATAAFETWFGRANDLAPRGRDAGRGNTKSFRAGEYKIILFADALRHFKSVSPVSVFVFSRHIGFSRRTDLPRAESKLLKTPATA